MTIYLKLCFADFDFAEDLSEAFPEREEELPLTIGPPQHVSSVSTHPHALLTTTSRPQSAQQNISSLLTFAMFHVLPFITNYD
jgi:hypothetical protein